MDLIYYQGTIDKVGRTPWHGKEIRDDLNIGPINGESWRRSERDNDFTGSGQVLGQATPKPASLLHGPYDWSRFLSFRSTHISLPLLVLKSLMRIFFFFLFFFFALATSMGAPFKPLHCRNFKFVAHLLQADNTLLHALIAQHSRTRKILLFR